MCCGLTVLGQQNGSVGEAIQGLPEITSLRLQQQQGLEDGQESERCWGAAYLERQYLSKSLYLNIKSNFLIIYVLKY